VMTETCSVDTDMCLGDTRGYGSDIAKFYVTALVAVTCSLSRDAKQEAQSAKRKTGGRSVLPGTLKRNWARLS
jgi:hypothetical protein